MKGVKLKVIGLKSKLELSKILYEVQKIEKKGVTLRNLKNNVVTLFPLESVVENLVSNVFIVKEI